MKRLSYVFVLLSATTCVVPTSVCGCPPAIGVTTVYGVVSRGGTPAGGVPVHLFGSTRGCTGENEIVSGGRRLVTDGAGRYRQLIGLISPNDTACVTVAAIDSLAVPLDSAVSVRKPVRAIVSYGPGYLADSVRIDVAFPIR